MRWLLPCTRLIFPARPKRWFVGLWLVMGMCFGFASGEAKGENRSAVSIGRPDPHIGKILHVVIIFQENRTPDNLFHGLPGADIADDGVDSKGDVIPLTSVSITPGYDMDHSHKAFLQMYDGGTMDGADQVSVTCVRPSCPAHPQFKYVNPAQVAPYFELARTYTFADRMFQTNQGPSFPAHQFIISGTSAPTADSDLFAAENPFRQSGPPPRSDFNRSGCTARPGVTVYMIDPAGNETQTMPPCFEHPTLSDLLDFKALGWRYYGVSDFWSSLWDGPNAISHIRFGPDWKNVVPYDTQIFQDIEQHRLPAISWVIPTAYASDHTSVTDGSGPSWVASVVNAIGESEYWSSTAIFITWDDWGGWYDHVAPPIYNSYEYGFRVPLIVVSPYAKRGYVSHEMHDFGSILRFIESNFGLPSLGYADSRADDLSDCFDFSQDPAKKFQRVRAPLGKEHFIKDRRRAVAIDDD